MLYQFTVSSIENWSVRSLGQWIIESKVYLLIVHARTEKKGSRLRLCFWFVDEVPEKNEWICRQVSICLHVFCGILFALKPFCDYSLCSVCILPQPAFYSQSVVCILPLVRSPQKTLYQAFRIMKAPKNYFIVNRVLATGCWGLGHYKLFFLFVNAACALFLWGQLVVLTLLAKIFEF